MGVSELIFEKDEAQDVRRKKELLMGRKSVDIDLVDELKKSLCKIKYKNVDTFGTGFFMYYESLKCLISAYHVINSNLLNKTIELELYNKEKIDLKLNNRIIKFFENLDISAVEIKDSDGINNKGIEYLSHDLNYKEGGYKQYKSIEIICLHYPGGKNLNAQCGNIIDIENEFEFEHDIPTDYGSSGAPIIIPNIKKVVGLHSSGDIEDKINFGYFIGEIFQKTKKKNTNQENKKYSNNDEKLILNLINKQLENQGKQNLVNYDNIIKLDLSFKNLSNIEAIKKVKLYKLEILHLFDNNISDIDILENVNFKELKVLDLSGNNISDIKVLEKVKFYKLKKLYLGRNNISNINILANVNFKELKELDLYHNKISDIKVLEIVKFDKLEILNLELNNISNIDILENVNFKELKELDLRWNNISDVKVLEKMNFEKLEILYLKSNYNLNIHSIFPKLKFKVSLK